MRFGAHVSIGKGLAGAVAFAEELGCDAFQIFAGNPRGWARKPLDPRDVEKYRTGLEASGLGPVAVHLSYLPNPAAPDPQLYERSVLAMAEDYRRAVQIGADYFIVHPCKGGPEQNRETALRRVAAAVKTVLRQIPGKALLLLVNQAGAGTEVAGRIEELARILELAGEEERTGICFDTCHAFAAGYDLRLQEGAAGLLTEIDRLLGLSRLHLLHLNDCIGECGSHLDRHYHIGKGKIGREGFKNLLTDPRLATRDDLAGIIETPADSADDDRENLAVLRELSGEEDGR
ncbi:MAG: deoxyribonuclease IV [Firmicutes bacterium]|nr:deoxyribonuclease IV [Bacillota bacterium]